MTAEPLFDSAASAKLDAVYRTPDVVTQRHETLIALRLGEGERVLDVGSGPGLLAAEMAERVGQTGQVAGVDISPSMVRLARQRCARTPIRDRIHFTRADATALPFADSTFDAAVSTQVYEYVSDLRTAFAELHRVLRHGGRVVIVDTDWDSIVWNAGDQARMRQVLAAWTERFADPHLPRTLARQLGDAGFVVHGCSALVLLNAGPGYDANT
ncbi:MAG TPA: methyltransferase domain-containing protein [Actinomycetota bacterium]